MLLSAENVPGQSAYGLGGGRRLKDFGFVGVSDVYVFKIISNKLKHIIMLIHFKFFTDVFANKNVDT